ncbi:MAG TPA: tetratricopeptide repeat protein [Thermoanaerobaculia bacterium]|nr:tetratricopeptide repeat protein [Thermoanaerobaculia bacterium]
MIRRLAVATLALAAWMAAVGVEAQQNSPRDLWPQAASAARENDYDGANKGLNDLLATEKTHGIDSFPMYAATAAGLASAAGPQNPELTNWATKAAIALDPRSPAVAFSEADRARRKNDWPGAIKLALQGFARVFGNYRTNLLSRADLLIVASAAILVTAILFAIALFIRYGRSVAHDFREMVSRRTSGGTVSVLAFALLFLPLFLWLGPMWLLLYWFVVCFGYASIGERIATVVLLVLIALLPLALDWTADRVAGVDSPVIMAAVSSSTHAYQPEALRRMQELIGLAPDQAALQVLTGNLLNFEGAEDQAENYYRRAIQLNPTYAGAQVNLGNLLFLKNEFPAAINAYEKAEKSDPNLAIAYYNHSVAASEIYKYDLQGQMLDRARRADRSFVERVTANPPPQKIVMYSPTIAEAWGVRDRIQNKPAVRALFGNYSTFDAMNSASNPLTLGAVLALLLALILWTLRRRNGFANACIKCGRTFCYRCKSARESSTYCTQCIHIYLKRDGVSIDTKRKKLEEVSDHQAAVQIRNRVFATFLPGSAQMLEGRTVTGALGIFFFALFVMIAIFTGRLAPALGPVADVAQLLVRIAAITVAVILWLTMSLPVYRRRAVP